MRLDDNGRCRVLFASSQGSGVVERRRTRREASGEFTAIADLKDKRGVIPVNGPYEAGIAQARARTHL